MEWHQPVNPSNSEHNILVQNANATTATSGWDRSRFGGRTGQLQDLINFNHTNAANEKTMSDHTSNTPQTDQSKPGVYWGSIMERFPLVLCRCVTTEHKSKLQKYESTLKGTAETRETGYLLRPMCRFKLRPVCFCPAVGWAAARVWGVFSMGDDELEDSETDADRYSSPQPGHLHPFSTSFFHFLATGERWEDLIADNFHTGPVKKK